MLTVLAPALRKRGPTCILILSGNTHPACLA